jgi:uncharacterized protein YjiS (DUF1127 family)
MLPSWSTWARIGARKLTGDLRRVLEAPLAWQERAQARRNLARLDDRMLRDIGVARADVWQELDKPFWRA